MCLFICIHENNINNREKVAINLRVGNMKEVGEMVPRRDWREESNVILFQLNFLCKPLDK